MEKLLDRITGLGFISNLREGNAVGFTKGKFILSIDFNYMFLVLETVNNNHTTSVFQTSFLKEANYDELISQIERIISIQEDYYVHRY